MADDGLVDRLARQQQQRGVAVGLQPQAVAFALQQRHLRLAHHLAVDQHRAAQHHHGGGVALGQCRRGLLALAQPHVPDVDGREGLRRPLVAVVAAGDHAHAAGAAGQGHSRDLLVDDALVMRRAHLVPGRQVDPQLHHLERAALLGERRRVKLLVQNARGRRHPLHIARAYGAAAAGRVLVRDLALVDDGHGLKTAVRMGADAAPLVGRAGGLELRRAGVVQQQKRAHMLAQRVVAKQRAHRKTVAHPVLAGVAVNA